MAKIERSLLNQLNKLFEPPTKMAMDSVKRECTAPEPSSSKSHPSSDAVTRSSSCSIIGSMEDEADDLLQLVERFRRMSLEDDERDNNHEGPSDTSLLLAPRLLGSTVILHSRFAEGMRGEWGLDASPSQEPAVSGFVARESRHSLNPNDLIFVPGTWSDSAFDIQLSLPHSLNYDAPIVVPNAWRRVPAIDHHLDLPAPRPTAFQPAAIPPFEPAWHDAFLDGILTADYSEQEKHSRALVRSFNWDIAEISGLVDRFCFDGLVLVSSPSNIASFSHAVHISLQVMLGDWEATYFMDHMSMRNASMFRKVWTAALPHVLTLGFSILGHAAYIGHLFMQRMISISQMSFSLASIVLAEPFYIEHAQALYMSISHAGPMLWQGSICNFDHASLFIDIFTKMSGLVEIMSITGRKCSKDEINKWITEIVMMVNRYLTQRRSVNIR